MKNWFLFLSVTFFSTWCAAQQKFENTLQYSDTTGSPNANFKDVAWIAGHWQGTAMGGEIEEVWTAAHGGSMMGSFKFVADGKVVFYELETITEENETLILRLKHFGDDLKGWEEKDDVVMFNLVKITADAAYFDQLTFKKNGEDGLDIYVVITTEKGPTETRFQYQRVN